MDLLEENTDSFVVKIWVDESAEFPQWQGQITHVASGKQICLQNLEHVRQFITGYLKQAAQPPILRRRGKT